jgi:putative membrane protein
MLDDRVVPRQPSDVDARFLLANERTLLAWVRTALAFVAVGAGVQQFGTDVNGRRSVAAVLVTLGAAAGLIGALRYRRADRAIRRGELPPSGGVPTALALAVVAVAVVVLVAVVLDARA